MNCESCLNNPGDFLCEGCPASNQCVVSVVLVDGMVWAWKALRPPWKGLTKDHHGKYFPAGHRSLVITATLCDWDGIATWAKQWPLHPDIQGFPPYPKNG
jgi:hypothetical protein